MGAARRALIPDADLETKPHERPASGGEPAGQSIRYYLTISLCSPDQARGKQQEVGGFGSAEKNIERESEKKRKKKTTDKYPQSCTKVILSEMAVNTNGEKRWN